MTAPSRARAWSHRLRIPLLPAIVLIAFVATGPAAAHEGHDHGAPATKPAAANLEPRATLVTQDVELVVIVSDGRLLVHADVFATNAPITGARIEIESAGRKAVAQPTQAEGTYAADAPWAMQPGEHELVVSIEAGPLTDLLIGKLVVPALDRVEPAGTPFRAPWPWIAGASALAVAGIALASIRRRRRTA